jgi:hypothetical protein
VTNQKEFLQKTKNVIYLNNGEIVSINSFNETNKEHLQFKNESVYKIAKKNHTAPTETESSFKNGLITWEIYPEFLNAAFGLLGSIFLLVIFISSQILIVVCDKWLFKLASENKHIFLNFSKINETSENFLYQKNNFIVYYILVFSVFLIFSLRTIFYYYYCVQGSAKLYKNMLRGVLNTKIYFFSMNSIGKNYYL